MIIQIKTYHKLLGTTHKYFFNKLSEVEVFKLGDPAFDINAELVSLSPYEVVTSDLILQATSH